MRKISVNNLQEGMTLAKPIIKPDGKILLAQGCTLSEKIISKFKEWGFDTAYVEGEAESDDEQVKIAGFDFYNTSIEKIILKIDFRFSKCSNKITSILKESIKQQILRKFNENEDDRQKRTEKISQQN